MNIAVLLKQVPDTTAKITISGGKVDGNSVSKWSMSPYDEYASRIRITDERCELVGLLIAITCGPDTNKENADRCSRSRGRYSSSHL